MQRPDGFVHPLLGKPCEETMRRVALIAGVAALLGTSGSALADGYGGGPAYAPHSYNWSGVYFGSHAGWGWGDANIRESLII